MNKSDSIGKLTAALVLARTAFKPAVKDASNPFFKSKYLTLEGCYDAIDAAMAANQLTVIQSTDVGPTGPVLVSTLVHSSGEWISGSYPLKPVKDDPQGMGSAMTYARRYCLMALVGLAAEDDDGEVSAGKRPKIAVASGKTETKKPTWTPEDQKRGGELRALFQQIGGDAYVTSLSRAMAYDLPKDVIAALDKTLSHWNRDQADAAAGAVESLHTAGASGELDSAAVKWDWTDPLTVIDNLTALLKQVEN